jgi:hypothetical protein
MSKSLHNYLDQFNGFYHECLSTTSLLNAQGNTDAYCVSQAALDVFRKVSSDFQKRGPGCELSSYFAVVMREVGGEHPDQTIRELLEKKSLKNILKAVSEFAVPLAGCAVGGTVASAGGGLIGFQGGGAPGATMGAAVSFPVGCAAGAVIATDVYVLYKGFYKLKNYSNLYNKVVAKATNVYEALQAHHRSCEARLDVRDQQYTSLRQTPIFWETAAPNYTPIRIYNTPRKEHSTTERPLIDTYEIIPPKPQALAASVLPAPTTVLLPQEKPLSAVFVAEIEDIAQQIVGIAGDLTGVTPALDQAKNLKELFVKVLSNPENATKLLVDQLIKEPQEIFKKILASPNEFIAKGDAFLSDPTLTGALGIVQTAFTIVSITNEILPVITKLKGTLKSNPLKVPEVITKELLNLTYNKIKAVYNLATGLFKDPLKTGVQLVKGVMATPKQLCRNVKSLFGGGSSKAKKAKRKAKQLKLLQAAMQQKMKIEEEKLRSAIAAIMPKCYRTAENQWMLKPGMAIESYFSAMVEDWKVARTTQHYTANFSDFAQMINEYLVVGRFSDVVQYSPQAHLNGPTTPVVVAYAIAELAQVTLQLAISTRSLEKAAEENRVVDQQLKAATASYAASNQALAQTLQAWIARRAIH